MSPLHPLDWAILITYLAAMIGLGLWLSRWARTSEQFMVAGRGLPGWAVGLSILGTYVSTISFIANPGKSYATNWNPFVFSLTLPFAAWLATAYFVPFYRRAGEISAYQHLESRFGPWARTYAVVCYLVLQVARMASIIYLVALTLQSILGIDILIIILVAGVLVTFYTVVGGIEAVIWTDVIQSVILTLGMVLSAVYLILLIPGGWSELQSVAAEQHKFSLGSLGGSLSMPTFWVVFINGMVTNLTNFGIDQSYVQRYITARSDAAARRSVWLGALCYLPVSAILFFVGTALFVYYQSSAELAQEVAQLPDDQIYPWFMATRLPVGIAGILIAAVLAAAMSSVDSSLNGSATLIYCDIYRRYVQPEPSERQAMWILHASTVVWGVLGTLAALAMVRAQSVLDVWWTWAGVISGGMLGLFLLGFLSRRVTSRAAAIAVGLGLIVLIWAALTNGKLLPPAWSFPLHPFLTSGVGTGVIVLTGFFLTVASRRFRANPREP